MSKTISSNSRKILLMAILVLVATLGRLFTNEIHLWNFAPIGALGLFGGAVLKNKRQAFLLLLVTLICSDLCLQLFTPIKGFYGWSQLLNYAAFVLITWMGTKINKPNTRNVVMASLAASLTFFVLSNFGVWLFAGGLPPYTHDGQGLVNTFSLGIPFFGNTIAGDLFYCGLLFGSWSLVGRLSFGKSSPTN